MLGFPDGAGMGTGGAVLVGGGAGAFRSLSDTVTAVVEISHMMCSLFITRCRWKQMRSNS